MAILSHKKKHIELLFITLLFTSCFGLLLLESRIFKYLFTLALFYFCMSNKGNVPCKRMILFYTSFVFCSCIYSAIYNHQDLVRVVGNTYAYWGILFVFIITKYNPTPLQLEKTIKYLSIIFCCCYFLQWTIYPTALFTSGLDETNISSDTFRMRMPGSICAYCLFFYGINHYLIYKKRQDLIYAFLGFLPIIIMGFRSLTAATAIFGIIMIPFVTQNITKTFIWLIVGCIAIISISQLNLVQTKVNEMLERQESGQTFANEDYIRFVEYEYFDGTIFTKPGERFWGGGVPADDSTSYYKSLIDATERLHFYWVDLGLIGLSYIIGIPAVLLLVGIVCKCIWKSHSIELQYIRFTLLTVLVGSIVTSMELFRASNILILSLFLCLIYTSNKASIHNSQNTYSQYTKR